MSVNALGSGEFVSSDENRDENSKRQAIRVVKQVVNKARGVFDS